MDSDILSTDAYLAPRVLPFLQNDSRNIFTGIPLNSSFVRLFDIVFSIIALIVSLPVMLVVALAVKLDTKGPALFIQERLGQHKKPFKMMKFRTMGLDAEANGAMWAQENDPRVTRVGRVLRKSRLDELPQFFNVLMGDMSMVGPRPIREIFASQLSEIEKTYDLRFLAKPGITGYAQIFSVYGSTVEDQLQKLEYDRMYVKGISLSIYFKLIFLTVKTMLVADGV